MTKPVSGDVWRYDYLWRWQHEAGETEGRKSRPVAFAAVVANKAGKTDLFILPITSVPPQGRLALEVPQIERRRAGLDDDKPLWIMLDEYNHDVLEGSFYFDPTARVGKFSETFRKLALRSFIEIARKKQTKRVPRGS